MQSHEHTSGPPGSELSQPYQRCTTITTPNLLSGGNATSQILNSQQSTATQHTYTRRENVFTPMSRIARVADSTAEQLQADFEGFLLKFQDPLTGKNCYLDQIKSLGRLGIVTIYIDFDHVMMWDEVVAKTIASQFHRMDSYLRKLIQNLVRRYDSSYINMKVGSIIVEKDNFREFWIAWYNLPNVMRLRDIRAADLGHLVSISGTVTRTSEVRPEILYGSYRCDECYSIIKDVEQEFKYTEPIACLKPTCNNRTNFKLLVDRSKFVDWQKIRIQENPEEIPSGSMPRTLDVILRNECVERTKPGDKIIVTGTPIVVPDVARLVGPHTEAQSYEERGRSKEGFSREGVTGLRELGVRDLTYRISFLGSLVQSSLSQTTLGALHDTSINAHSRDTQTVLNEMTEEEIMQIEEMKNDRLLYQKLVSSISPNIFGHEDVKKGILLQLLGGVHKITPEKINLRGDINVCIVGDPSTAKSQFLSYVSKIMPNAVYTSGKASSAAGLTASVIKDEETGEFSIEAGALMLADNGICCIDEFDKMDHKDQVAIHEAMEQQTISITKAGIQATLNARASVLAAANPIYGRYDKKLTLKQNINLSSSLMSRFDVFFAVIDECNEATDWNVARHIVNFHRQSGEIKPEYTAEQLVRYIKYAKTFKPKITKEVIRCLVQQYRDIRQGDSFMPGFSSYRVTVRQLESMIRLSEALAKLYTSDVVRVEYVKEAAHILKTSVVRVEQSNIDMEYTEDTKDSSLNQIGGLVGSSLTTQKTLSTQKTTTSDTSRKTRIKIYAEEYDKIVQSLILKLCDHTAEKTTDDDTISGGLRKSELIEWYLEMLEKDNAIDTEETLIYQMKLVRCVIDRLIKKDHILLELYEPSTLNTGESLNQETSQYTDDPIVMLHPNYSLGT